jgi:hypothetical protein
MRSWFYKSAAVFVFVVAISSPCLAQNPSGPRTLEGLLNADGAQHAPTAPVAEPNPAGPHRPAGTAARPRDGVQHPDLDKAWAKYEAAVSKASDEIKAAVTKQFDAAAAKGDLDLAEKWQSALEKFEKAGQVPSGSETKSAVSAAVADYKKARDALSTAYEAVMKALTMEKKIAEAKAARDEFESLGSPRRDGRVEQRPDIRGGLLGEYFADANLKEKVRENVDEVISFNWKGGAPHGLPNDRFSIRWSGSLLPTETGDYVITGNSDDGLRIAIDGRIVVDQWQSRNGEFRSAPVHLTKGKSHKVVIEYCEHLWGASFRLEWIKPDGIRQVVPNESLVPTRAARGR